jgi:sulfate permease, SulP family
MAGLIALTSALLMPLFENLPQAVLGAIVISAVLGFVNLPALLWLQRLRRDSFVVAVFAAVGVLLLGVLPGLLLAVALSIVMLLGYQSRPADSVLGQLPGSRIFVDSSRHAEAVVRPDLLVYRLDAPLLFINAGWMRDALRERLRQLDPRPRVVVIDLEMSGDLDVKGLGTLTQVEADLAESGIELRLANVHGRVLDVLRRGGFAAKIGESRIHRTLESAVNDGSAAALATSAASIAAAR